MANVPEGMTPEAELAWIQESGIEATQSEINEIEATDALKKMLAKPAAEEYSSYKFGDAEIRYRKFMTSALRRQLITASRKSKVADSEQKLHIQDETVYRVLSELCVDKPYNTPVFWAMVDQRSTDGRVYKIFMDLIKSVGGTEQTLKTFQ